MNEDATLRPITLEQFEGTLHGMGTAVAKLPIDEYAGRQKDPGAKLVYTGYVLLFQYEDPKIPGKVYTANPTSWHVEDTSHARFQVSENLDIVNGVVGRKTNLLAQLVAHFGEAGPLLRILSAWNQLTPLLQMLVPSLSNLSPDGWLKKLLVKKAIPGKAAVKLLDAAAEQ